jgi:8-oxo-dGTP pyrophosphatase MutT (NUDIX family)
VTDDSPDVVPTASRIVYENRWMRVREDDVRRRDGSTGIYGVIEKTDFVLVVPVHEDGALELVEQYRYPMGERLWEFPMGIWGPPGTDPLLAAQHELAEETGLIAATLLHVGTLHQAPGTMRQAAHIVLARGLTRGPARPEIEEQDLISRRIPRAEFERMVRDGEIRDAISVAAWCLLLMKRLV